MIPRAAADTLQRLSQTMPIVALTGPRQSGKTTLARAVFSHKPYVTLEDPDRQQAADEDPRGFLAAYPDGAVIDEAQRCPDLFRYLQGVVDQDGRMGLFVLTGSQQFGFLAGVTQSLAGRVGMVELLPFTWAELDAAGAAPRGLGELLHRGLYPPIYDRNAPAEKWYADYVRSYVERDVRQLLQVRELSTFSTFARMCAARTGQLLNLSSLASDCGITHNTARAWLSVLEASYVVHLLRPHHRNFNKRLIRSPKLYFLDSGLAAWLLRIRSPDELAIHAMRGPLFETWVVSELVKSWANRGLPPPLYFWRDRAGHEVDVLIERADGLMPVELKSGATVTRDQLAGLQRFATLAGDACVRPSLIHGGDAMGSRSGAQVVPWRKLPEMIESLHGV